MKKVMFILIMMTVLFLINAPIIHAIQNNNEQAEEDTRDKIDKQVIKIVKIVGYVIVLGFGIKDIIMEARKRDLQALGNTVLTYIVIYAALLGLPTFLKMVEGFIEGLN